MKKLFTATLIMVVASSSIFADYPIANPKSGQYIISASQPNEVPVKATPNTLKEINSMSPFGRWIYEIELMLLTGHGGWK